MTRKTYTLSEVLSQIDAIMKTTNCSRQDAYFWLRRWCPDQFEALSELLRNDPAAIRRRRSSQAA